MAKVPVIRGRVWKASGNWYFEVRSDGHVVPVQDHGAPWPTHRLALLSANAEVRKRREYWEKASA